MTLAPPIKLEPGTCGCSVDRKACACMPADAGELLSQLSEARYRGDEAERTRIAKKLNDSMTYRADGGARKDAMTTPKSIDTSPLTSERRDEMITELSKLRLEAGVSVGEVREDERRMREKSDVGLRAYVEAMTEGTRKLIEYDRRKRNDAAIKEITQVTEADRQQAIADLEAMRADAQFRAGYASPHAKRADASDEDHLMAIDMRAREIAKRRVARENADAQMRATPRKPAAEVRTDAESERDPYAPTLAADPAWTRKGRR